MATPHSNIDCVICHDEFAENGILLLCCVPKQGEGEIKKICNPCAAELHIHYLKTKIENYRFLPKCPYCRTVFNRESLDNIKKIYSQIYTDEQRKEIDKLLFTLQPSPILEIQRFIPDPERQRVILALERYCRIFKKRKIIEEYKLSQYMHQISKEEIEQESIDALCTKQKTSNRQDKKCCAAFRDMVKQNPNIFPKKSYRKNKEDDSDFDGFDGFDADDAFNAFDAFLCF